MRFFYRELVTVRRGVVFIFQKTLHQARSRWSRTNNSVNVTLVWMNGLLSKCLFLAFSTLTSNIPSLSTSNYFSNMLTLFQCGRGILFGLARALDFDPLSPGHNLQYLSHSREIFNKYFVIFLLGRKVSIL